MLMSSNGGLLHLNHRYLFSVDTAWLSAKPPLATIVSTCSGSSLSVTLYSPDKRPRVRVVVSPTKLY